MLDATTSGLGPINFPTSTQTESTDQNVSTIEQVLGDDKQQQKQKKTSRNETVFKCLWQEFLALSGQWSQTHALGQRCLNGKDPLLFL